MKSPIPEAKWAGVSHIQSPICGVNFSRDLF